MWKGVGLHRLHLEQEVLDACLFTSQHENLMRCHIHQSRPKCTLTRCLFESLTCKCLLFAFETGTLGKALSSDAVHDNVEQFFAMQSLSRHQVLVAASKSTTRLPPPVILCLFVCHVFLGACR